jgi:methionyl-tRNA formyltransferase
LRVAFFGSPAFALPVLEALRERFEIVLVVAQPDKPAGRGLKLTPPPVAVRAAELGLALEQPQRLRRNEAFSDRLRASGADVAVTCAYGKILPADLLAVPRHGFLNVHTSLLPRYRGAAPIQWALINGEDRTGVTIMRTDPGLDTGPVLLQESLAIGPDETALALAPRLSALGARLIVQAIEEIDSLREELQDDSLATLAPLLTKDDGRIRFGDAASAVLNRYRGTAGWPGSWLEHGGRRLKVLSLALGEGSGEPGTVLALEPELTIAAAEGAVRLVVVQPEGRSRQTGSEWARAVGLSPGARLS